MRDGVRPERTDKLKDVLELSGKGAAARTVPYPKEVELRGKVSRDLVEEVSKVKGEPEWMRLLRLRALEAFERLPTPNWLEGVESIDLDEIAAYVKPAL